jgi:hypothetical protein
MPDRDQLRQAHESVRRIREADTPPLHGCESWIDYATRHQHVGTVPCWQCAARDRAMAERDEMGARIAELEALLPEAFRAGSAWWCSANDPAFKVVAPDENTWVREALGGES